MAIGRHFRFAVFLVAYKDDALLPRLRVVAFLEAIGPDVPIEYVHIRLRGQGLDHESVLDRLAATHARTVGPRFVPRADALDHDHSFGAVSIGREEGVA